jgi:hypothetical protein
MVDSGFPHTMAQTVYAYFSINRFENGSCCQAVIGLFIQRNKNGIIWSTIWAENECVITVIWHRGVSSCGYLYVDHVVIVKMRLIINSNTMAQYMRIFYIDRFANVSCLSGHDWLIYAVQ